MNERFNKVFEYWFYAISQQGKSIYYSQYVKLINDYIKPHFFNYKMKNINAMMLNQFKGKMQSLKIRQGGPEGFEAHKLIVDFVEYALKNKMLNEKNVNYVRKAKKDDGTDEEVEEVYRRMHQIK